jgi:hypothetical protein
VFFGDAKPVHRDFEYPAALNLSVNSQFGSEAGEEVQQENASLCQQRHPQQNRRKDRGEQAIETVRADPGHIEYPQHIREHRKRPEE